MQLYKPWYFIYISSDSPFMIFARLLDPFFGGRRGGWLFWVLDLFAHVYVKLLISLTFDLLKQQFHIVQPCLGYNCKFSEERGHSYLPWVPATLSLMVTESGLSRTGNGHESSSHLNSRFRSMHCSCVRAHNHTSPMTQILRGHPSSVGEQRHRDVRELT